MATTMLEGEKHIRISFYLFVFSHFTLSFFFFSNLMCIQKENNALDVEAG
jgi:hypothetical protein